MTSADEVKKLAALARLSIPEQDLGRFAEEFDGILAYVGQLENLNIDHRDMKARAVRNVFRADTNPHESGAYTEKIVAQFPKKEGNALAVKQIITHD